MATSLAHSTDAARSTAPAAVPHVATESQLTSVTLSAKAVRRLGIETAPVDSAVIAPMRALGASPSALFVPLGALIRDMGGGNWVYERADSSTFIRRRVEVVRISNGRALLSAGPRAGTPVVVTGAARLFGAEFGDCE
jgi:hypothetical protein